MRTARLTRPPYHRCHAAPAADEARQEQQQRAPLKSSRRGGSFLGRVQLAAEESWMGSSGPDLSAQGWTCPTPKLVRAVGRLGRGAALACRKPTGSVHLRQRPPRPWMWRGTGQMTSSKQRHQLLKLDPCPGLASAAWCGRNVCVRRTHGGRDKASLPPPLARCLQANCQRKSTLSQAGRQRVLNEGFSWCSVVHRDRDAPRPARGGGQR